MDILEIANEYGPLAFIAIFSLFNVADIIKSWLKDQREFNQEITRNSLSGKYNNNDDDDNEVTIRERIASIETCLEYQSKKMENIETQTTNHVSEIQDDIEKMKKNYNNIDKSVALICSDIKSIKDKLE